MVHILALLIVVVFILYLVIRKTLTKKLTIDNNGWIYKPINRLHRRAEIVAFALMLLILYRASFILNHPWQVYLFGGMSVLYAFRAYMEWKFERKSKRYILSIIDSSAYIIIFILLAISWNTF